MPNAVAYACSPSTGKSRVQDQTGLYRKYDSPGDVTSLSIREYIYILQRN